MLSLVRVWCLAITSMISIVGLDMVECPGWIRLCSPSRELPIPFAISEELKLGLVQHLNVKIGVGILAGLSPGRRCHVGSIQGLPEPPGLLPNLNKNLWLYSRAVHILQVWMSIISVVGPSTSPTFLLLNCQAIRFAIQVVAICFKRLCSPKAHKTVVFWIQWGWEMFAGR